MDSAQLGRTLAVDPGGTTGLALVDASDAAVRRVWQIHTIRDGNTQLAQLVQDIEEARPTTIVCEDFRLRRGAALPLIGSDFPASQVIGVVRYAAELLGTPLYMVSPANKSQFTARKLRWLGVRAKSAHMQDAVAHALAFECARRKELETQLYARMAAAREAERGHMTGG